MKREKIDKRRFFLSRLLPNCHEAAGAAAFVFVANPTVHVFGIFLTLQGRRTGIGLTKA